MPMHRLLAIMKKEFRQIGRDPLSLGVLLFVPTMLLMLYGYALSFDVKHVRMGVLDFDRTPASRELLDSLFRNPYFDRACDAARFDDADRLLRRNAVQAVIVLPRGYARTLARGEPADVQVLIDGSNANTASAIMGYVDALADRMTRRVRTDWAEARGLREELPGVRLEPRIWFNPEVKSARFLVPGLVALLMMLSAVIATSLSVVREKERRTMEQIMVSPLHPIELLAGKALPYAAICVVTMALVLALGYAMFDVRVMGSFALLALATVVFLFAALGMGIFISTVTHTQQIAFMAAMIAALLPSILLSGFIFPIANMPLPIQAVTLIVIPRYFVGALRAIILKAAPLHDLWPDLGGMLAVGLLFYLLAMLKTRKAL